MVMWKVSGWIAGHGDFEYHFTTKETAEKCYNKYVTHKKEIEEGFLANLKIQTYWRI